ncbi:MAG: hypothetical protein Q9165_000566 [Trypethelium subeluteriae]
MAKTHVYIITRNDFLHDKDKQGNLALVSAHRSLENANAAAKAHLENEKPKGKPSGDVDVDEDETKDGGYEATAIVATSKRHHFTVKVAKLELKDGEATTAIGEAKATGASKSKASKESTLNKKRKAKDVVDDEKGDEEVAEEAAEEEGKKKTAKAKKGGAKKSKDESSKPATAEGTPDCLSGLSFVISGVLEGFTRDEAKALVIDRGGKTLSGISKNVDYVILGVNAGPKKLEQIEDLGLQTLDFEEFNDLVKERSGQ